MSVVKEINFVQHSDHITNSRIWCVNWHYSGKNLISCGADKTAKIWKFNDDKLEKIQTLSGDHSRSIRYGTFSLCGNYLSTASFDASVIIYEYIDGLFEEKHKLEGHENEVKCVQFSPNGKYIATCSRDKTVFIWELDDDETEYNLQSVIQKHTADVKCIKWHPEHELLVSCGYDDSICLHYFDGEDWIAGQYIESAHDSTIWCSSWDDAGRYLVTVGDDHTLKIWELIDPLPTSKAKLMKIATFEFDSKWPIFSVDWNVKTGLIAVGGADMKVKILEFSKDNQTINLLAEKYVDSEVNSLAWNPEFSDILATGCDDGIIRILRISN